MPARVALYVPRLDDTDALPRPTRAVWLGGNLYRILSETPPGEVWAYEPGSVVVAERKGGLLRAIDAGDGDTPEPAEFAAPPRPRPVLHRPSLELFEERLFEPDAWEPEPAATPEPLRAGPAAAVFADLARQHRPPIALVPQPMVVPEPFEPQPEMAPDPEPAAVQVFTAPSKPPRGPRDPLQFSGPIVPWWGWFAACVVIGILIILGFQIVEGS